MNSTNKPLLCLLLLLIAFVSIINAGNYSIKFFSTNTQNIGYDITVNGVVISSVTNFEIQSPSSDWIVFTASPGDSLNVKITDVSYDSFGLSYLINNEANGGGTQIYDSKSNTFTPTNTCLVGPCTDTINGVNFQQSSAIIYVNNVAVISDFDGSEREFTYYPEDLLRIVFTFDSNVNFVFYFLELDGSFNNWYYNSNGQNTRIPNPSNSNPSRSPFGGPYYPITTEEIESFALSTSPGNWGPIRTRFLNNPFI